MARPEDRLQARCAMFLNTHALPPTFWTAVEHGRKHGGTKEQRAREWQRLARKGVKTGLADLWFIMPGFVFAVELKVDSDQSDSQERVQKSLQALGHGYVVVRSVEAMGAALEANGIPLAAGWRLKAQIHDLALDAVPRATTKRPSKPRAAKPTRKAVGVGNRVSLFMARGAV